MDKFFWLALCLPILAQAGVYRWVDGDGVVHYSEAPPAEGGYQAMPPPSPATAAPAVEQNRAYLEQLDAEHDRADDARRQRDAQAQANQRRSDACSSAQASLQRLQERSPNRFLSRADDGSVSRMTSEQWQAEQKRLQDFLAANCDSGATAEAPSGSSAASPPTAPEAQRVPLGSEAGSGDQAAVGAGAALATPSDDATPANPAEARDGDRPAPPP
jgi:hypothetical protein